MPGQTHLSRSTRMPPRHLLNDPQQKPPRPHPRRAGEVSVRAIPNERWAHPEDIQ